MTELQEIKQKIHSEKRIKELLEIIGCESISTEQRGDLITASLPDGSNTRSVQVRNNKFLSSSIRSRGLRGDIYDIVSYIIYGVSSESDLKSTLHRSKYWICTKLGYLEFVDDFYRETSGNVVESVVNYNQWLSKITSSTISEPLANTVVDNSLLNAYETIPYYGWIEEGIDFATQKEFGVGIDIRSERITFPVYNYQGDLIGVKGRYCGSDEAVERRYKYIYLIPCNKSIEFFNLHRAMPYIVEKKEVIIVEGAKTVMLLFAWGYKNVISIEGDVMTNTQIDILRELGLDIKYIFVWDKDKDVEYVLQEAQRLQGRMRYAMLDTGELLEEKDSPVDRGREIWKTLLEKHLFKIR